MSGQRISGSLGTRILSAIPAPPGNAVHLGPFELRAYGLMIALGVMAAVRFAGQRWRARGGDPTDIGAIAVWAVPAGLIGARAYHVITDPELFKGRWVHVFFIWEGGLGIPGGILAGVVAGAYVAHKRGLPVAQLLDMAAPAFPLAQAIGRVGNWFNQELFGRPTHLPWGLHVDLAYRPLGYERFTTFQPTFAYEALWNLALVATLLAIERRWQRRPGRLFPLYLGGYFLGRLWVEALRIDHANHILGLRVNTWISLLTIAAVALFFAIDHRRAQLRSTVAAPDDTAAPTPSTT